MEPWLIYITISIALYTGNTILNKLTAKNYSGEFASLGLQIIVSLMLLPFVKNLPTGTWVWGWTLVAGFLYGVSSIIVFNAYSFGDVSIIAPLFNFQPVVVLILAVLFLGEGFTIQKFLGIMFVLIGATYLKKSHSVKSSLKSLFELKSARLALIATTLFSVARTIDKMVLPYFDTMTYSFVQWILPGAIVASYVLRKYEVHKFVRFFKKRFNIILINAICGGFGYVFFLMALRTAEVSIIAPLVNLNTLFAVILSHKFLGEKLNGRLLAVTIMIIGAALVVISS